jgi:hypothetical protein
MNDEILITYSTSRHVPQRGSYAHIFSLRKGSSWGQCTILVDEIVIYMIDQEFGDGGAARASYRLGLRELEAGIAAGVYELSREKPLEFVFGDDRLDVLKAELRATKSCAWQESSAPRPGKVCLASQPHAPATGQICAACPMPDDHERCADLVYARVGGVDPNMGPGAGMIPTLVAALCDVGEDCQIGPKCGYRVTKESVEDWNRQCWKRRLVSGQNRTAPPEDIAERLCDEIDHFGPQYRTDFGKNLWPIKQARSIGVLFSGCSDLKELMGNIAALGDLLDQLKVPRSCRLDEDGQPICGPDGKALGELSLFKKMIEEDYPAAAAHATMLISIRDARNGWPTHTQSRIASTFEDLSLTYPPQDPNYAWRQMMANLHDALKGIRTAMQTGPHVEPKDAT